MVIGIRVDGNKIIGMGHFSRCRSIGDELRARGVKVYFICSKDSCFPTLDSDENDFIRIVDSLYNNWNTDAELELISELGITTLLVDSYSINQEYLEAIKNIAKTVILDDLNLFDYHVDAIINYNIESTKEMYKKTKYHERKVYTGVEYFPLRNDLVAYLGKTQIRRKVKRVLITSGGTDPYNCVEKIIQAIKAVEFKNILFYILIGNCFSNEYVGELRNRYEKKANLCFLSWGQQMGKIYSQVDLVVSPGSTTVYEALSLGVPCITFEFMDNQHEECIALDKMGIAFWAGKISKSSDIFSNRMRECFLSALDYETRRTQGFRFSSLFDGKGVDRILKVLFEVDNEKRI